MKARAVGLLIGFAADRFLGDPSRGHPVAGFGIVAGKFERHFYADSRRAGVRHVAVLVGSVVVLGAAAERRTKHPIARALLTTAATWAVLGGRSLEREAQGVEKLLKRDLAAARQRLTHLVGRDTTMLTEAEVARAVIESVAENTSDAVVAPLVWGAIAGVPGLLGYRAANTLDAMVGHHNPRYENFGWAAARFDDLLNLPGSRCAGLLVVLTSGRPREVLDAWRADAARHPSPNAGVVEASFAGALGIRLGGTNHYGDRIEHRAVMGTGGPPAISDIAAANRLARRVDGGAVVLTALGAALVARSNGYVGSRGRDGRRSIRRHRRQTPRAQR